MGTVRKRPEDAATAANGDADEPDGVDDDAEDAAGDDGVSGETALETEATATMADGGPPPLPDAVPSEIAGRYQIVGEIGRGGMGTVYRAFDLRLGRRVALKLVASSAVRRNRLLREAQALAQLAHPNVVPVYDVGVVDDTVYMAMELIDGIDLRRWLADEKRSSDEILRAFAAAGDGLAAAHAAGLVHRDFKPANVIIGSDGRVRVLDFGLARAIPNPESESSLPATPAVTPGDAPPESSGSVPAVDAGDAPATLLGSSLTRIGHIVGTPRYMAPEQRRGRATDARTDQFSFCVALYEALYEQRPFLDRETRRLFDKTGANPIEPPARRDVPKRVRRALRRGLSWEPGNRYASMTTLVAELRRDMRAVRIRTAVAVGGVAAVSLSIATAAFLVHDAEPCGGAAERATSVWPSTLRGEVERALLATGSPHATWVAARLGTQVDDYIQRWSDLRTQACRATRVHGEQSELTMERRIRCLDDSLDQVAAYLRALAANASALNRASSELYRVSALALCSDADALARRQQEPIAPAEAATVAALQGAVRELTALNAVSNAQAAEPVARRVLEMAQRISHVETRAQAIYQYAETARMRGALVENAQKLDEVLRLAAQTENATLLADAWSGLLWQAAVEERRPLATEELLRATEVALVLARTEPDYGRLQVEIGHVIATAHLHGGRLAEAERRFRQLLTQPQHETRLSATSNNLGLVLIYLGRLGEARTLLERSRQLDEAAFGSAQPYYGDYALNVGLTHHWQGDLPAAERWYRIAMAHSIEHDGADGKNPLFLLYLGHILIDRGMWKDAETELDQALAGFEASVGEDAELTRHTRVQRARLYLARGEVPRARAEIDAVEAAATRTASADRLPPGYTDPLVVAARAAMAEGKPAAAETALRRSLERYHQVYGPAGLLVSEPELALAELALTSRRFSDAIDAAGRVLELLERGGSHANDPRRAEALLVRARARIARDRGSEAADEDARQALAIWQAAAPQHPRIAELRTLLAGRGRAP